MRAILDHVVQRSTCYRKENDMSMGMVPFLRYKNKKYVPETYFDKTVFEMIDMKQSDFDTFIMLFKVWIHMTNTEANERQTAFQNDIKRRLKIALTAR